MAAFPLARRGNATKRCAQYAYYSSVMADCQSVAPLKLGQKLGQRFLRRRQQAPATHRPAPGLVAAIARQRPLAIGGVTETPRPQAYHTSYMGDDRPGTGTRVDLLSATDGN